MTSSTSPASAASAEGRIPASCERRIPASFMRGGTSKAIMFDARDLPADTAAWDAIFLRAMGSPDPYGRQLDGMGGGISSLSKVCVIGPSSRPDADVDYTFAQIGIDVARVDYSGNCGNMSSAVGPFAVDRGIVRVQGGEARVRIYNTNTRKLIHAVFAVRDGRFASDGELAIPGVAGTGSPIRLEFLQPGGASTGALLPTGHARDVLAVPGHGEFEVSMVDAANACVFVAARSLRLAGTEMPAELDRNATLLATLDAIRVQAAIAMGLARNIEEARARKAVPFVGFVAAPQDSRTLAGTAIAAADVDLVARMLSSGQPHRALPLTASLCLAVAAQIEGSVVQGVARAGSDGVVRLATPSGVIQASADVRRTGDRWHAQSGSFYRTARRLFEGWVYC